MIDPRPALAKKVVIDNNRDDFKTSITVDGQEFPWLLSDEGVTVQFTPDGRPVVVLLPLLAESVHLITPHDEVVYGKDADL